MKLFVHIIAILGFLMTGTVCFGDCSAMPMESQKAQVFVQEKTVVPPCHGHADSESPVEKKSADDCGQLMFKSDCTGEQTNLVKVDNFQKPDVTITAIQYPPITLAVISDISDIQSTSPRGPPPEYLARLERPLPHITTQRLLI